MYNTSMLPSKVMSYLTRLAAPLMDSSIVQMATNKGKTLFYFRYDLMLNLGIFKLAQHKIRVINFGRGQDCFEFSRVQMMG